jgi:hypothetical protein
MDEISAHRPFRRHGIIRDGWLFSECSMLRIALWYLARHPILTLSAVARDPSDLWADFDAGNADTTGVIGNGTSQMRTGVPWRTQTRGGGAQGHLSSGRRRR